ncbi:MAG: TonB family protein [Bacteroidota bacterium]|nr:TonB family protein [Bacteroidota bacterium]
MSLILAYLLRMTLVSGLMYAYYWCCLRNRSYHGYNRFFLLGITVVSLVLPFVSIPILDAVAAGASPSAIAALHRITAGAWDEAITPGRHGGWLDGFLNGRTASYSVYALGMGVFLAATLASLFTILRICRRYPAQRVDGIRIFFTREPGTPFSFLRSIFWDDRLVMNTRHGRQIFRHELYHVRQLHTLDILWLETLRILFWCNPFFHLIRKEIKAIHEFLADRYATSARGERAADDEPAGYDGHAYAELLVWQAAGNPSPAFVHSFFNTHLKRRIIMLTHLKNTRSGYFSRIMVLPLVFLLFCAFATRLTKLTRAAGSHVLHPPTALTVVIDAGHGGFDAGTVSPSGDAEKNIALDIAKKIRQLSPAYSVQVLMTRDRDEMAGNKTTIPDGLHYRTDFANEHKADLFISIHVNNGGTPDGKPEGIQVWTSTQNAAAQKSVALGSALIDEMKKTYPTDDEIKQGGQGLWVLKAASMPAVLLECGNILSAKDRAFIVSGQGQEMVARSILQGIVHYEESMNAGDTGAPAPIAPVPSVPAPAVKGAHPAAPHIAPAAASTVAPVTPLAPASPRVGIPAQPSSAASIDLVPVAAGPSEVAPAAGDQTTEQDEPEYPGGQAAWIKYLIANARYPQDAAEKKVEGKVMLRFRVDADGSVSDIREIGEDPGHGLGAEAIRLVKASGKWLPAVKGGKPVVAYKIQPILFLLNKN